MKDYAEMLQALADKFGTTVEHLWGVMVYQAPLSATINVLQSIGLALFLIWGLKLVTNKTTRPQGEDYQRAEWSEEGAVAAWFVWGIAALFITVFIVTTVENIATGFLNPEYWALMRIKG